ncbi:MAG: mechanosensitive ion channel [Bdellovibrionaceae bacterium]|nr:mechanosensitive ion channel [Pseudobdellovibrionaceae bacterium]
MNDVQQEAGKIAVTSELIYAKLFEYVVDYGLKVLGAIVVIMVGFWLSNRLASLLTRALDKKGFDITIRAYLERVSAVGFKVMVVITAAGMVGVQTTSFVALLGAAGLAIGLALQGSLSNLAGGLLILILRPFRIGDYIQTQGEEGTVQAIDIFNTTLLRADNRKVIIPNGPLIGNVITNYSSESIRRVDVSVGVSYGDNVAKVEQMLLVLAKNDPRILADPEPMVGIVGFGDSSVDLTYRIWCKTEDYWPVRFDMYRKVKETFEAQGITIPFPQREVRMLNK